MREGLQLVRKKVIGVLANLAKFADEYKTMPCLAYTHCQPAQLTTVGKRATLWMNELYMDLEELDHQISQLALRGVKGTTGNQASFVELFNGDSAKMDDALCLGALQAVGVDVAHHVMADELLARNGVLIVDVVHVRLQLGNLLIGVGQALLLLGLSQRDPQPAPGAELVVVREDVLHLIRRIAGRERRNIFVVFAIGSNPHNLLS